MSPSSDLQLELQFHIEDRRGARDNLSLTMAFTDVQVNSGVGNNHRKHILID